MFASVWSNRPPIPFNIYTEENYEQETLENFIVSSMYTMHLEFSIIS